MSYKVTAYCPRREKGLKRLKELIKAEWLVKIKLYET